MEVLSTGAGQSSVRSFGFLFLKCLSQHCILCSHISLGAQLLLFVCEHFFSGHHLHWIRAHHTSLIFNFTFFKDSISKLTTLYGSGSKDFNIWTWRGHSSVPNILPSGLPKFMSFLHANFVYPHPSSSNLSLILKLTSGVKLDCWR